LEANVCALQSFFLLEYFLSVRFKQKKLLMRIHLLRMYARRDFFGFRVREREREREREKKRERRGLGLRVFDDLVVQ
jgi:hypothetical protein